MDAAKSKQTDISVGAAEGAAEDRAPAPENWGGRERRLNIRVFEYWDSLLNGRNFPSVADLEPEKLSDFRDNSLLIDFTKGYDHPVLRYIGKALREECGLAVNEADPEAVPRGSMLSRLTDHYLEILANRAPIGFEAEFVNARGRLSLYRGILLPLADDDETINFIFGAVSWKEQALEDGAAAGADDILELDMPAIDLADETEEPLDLVEAVAETDTGAPFDIDSLVAEIDAALGEAAPARAAKVENLLADAEDEYLTDAVVEAEMASSGDSENASLQHELSEVEKLLDPVSEMAPDLAPAASPKQTAEANRGPAADELRRRLDACRSAAQALDQVDQRSRATLYEALGQAYDFYQASIDNPTDYETLLDESGIKRQDRAPFTPIVKLVFGKSYDKTRITEYAACLSYAQREQTRTGHFVNFIENFEGGIKACVKAERMARRAEKGNQSRDKLAEAKAALRHAAPLAAVDMPEDSLDPKAEFVLLLARRAPGANKIEIIDIMEDSATALESNLKRAAKRAETPDDSGSS